MPDEIELSPKDLGQRADRLGVTPEDLKLVENGEVHVNVLVAGIPVDARLKDGKVKVTPPPAIGDGPWTIVVTTKTDKIINILAYDPKKKTLHTPVDILDEEDGGKGGA
jgi:hypothetical protein